VNAVASGLGPDIDHRVALAGRARIENLIFAHQAERERVHQRIARVARLKFRLAAEIRHAEAVSVGGDSADHAFENGVILVEFGPCGVSLCGNSRPGLSSGAWLGGRAGPNRPEAQRIHHRDRARAHGEDVAQDAADAGSCALKRLDKRRVVVRLDLEGAGPAIADVDDAGVLARPLHHAAAARGQALEVHAR